MESTPSLLDISFKKIENMYRYVNYEDIYMGSIVILIFVTVLVIILNAYLNALLYREIIVEHWATERCKPSNILFAGFLNAPVGKTMLQYTGENFKYCVDSLVSKQAQNAVSPFSFLVNICGSVMMGLVDAVNAMRAMLASLSAAFLGIAQMFFQRLYNGIIPIQTLFLIIQDMFQKMMGIVVTVLYGIKTFYMTVRAFGGAVLELLTIFATGLIIIAVLLLLIPFFWVLGIAQAQIIFGVSVLAVVIFTIVVVKEVTGEEIMALPKMPKI
jgi:hypothetical protein